MNRLFTLVLISIVVFLLTGCGNSNETEPASDAQADSESTDSHTHADGSTHTDHDEAEDHEGEDHAHDEVSLGMAIIGEMEVELAQGHGAVEPGKEGHLVVKLPYNDNGETIVRAWIGTNDRTLSFVGMGDYAPSHDDYDVHAMAPDPLPENVMWWIEIEKPDGSKFVGSKAAIME